MLPAFVLYWAAAAAFNFAVGTGAFKESCTAWIFIFCWVLQLVFGFYGGLNKNTRAFNSTGVNFCKALRLITERREFHRRRKVCL